jgi:hypothetical protein
VPLSGDVTAEHHSPRKHRRGLPIDRLQAVVSNLRCDRCLLQPSDRLHSQQLFILGGEISAKDSVDELFCIPHPWFLRAGLMGAETQMAIRTNPNGQVKIGARGFEPPTPCAQGRCASQTALRPVKSLLILQHFQISLSSNSFPHPSLARRFIF